jgi:hypothetical protein
VEATPARTYDEVAATKTMIKRTDERLGLSPSGSPPIQRTEPVSSHWLVDTGITPHIPVWDMSQREDGTFSRADFVFDPERDVYTCPRGKLLRTTGRIHDGRVMSAR